MGFTYLMCLQLLVEYVKKYNAIVVATKVIKEPNSNPYLKHMQFTIICYTRYFKHIKEDLGQCILSRLNRLEYIIEEG